MTILAFVFCVGFAAGQADGARDVVLSESFETDGQGSRYTASQPFNSEGNYWDRGENADFDTLLERGYANSDGRFFWAAEDVDSTNPG